MFCENCGNLLDENDKFCGKCGVPVPKHDDLSPAPVAADPEFDETPVFTLPESEDNPPKKKISGGVIAVIVTASLLAVTFVTVGVLLMTGVIGRQGAAPAVSPGTVEQPKETPPTQDPAPTEQEQNTLPETKADTDEPPIEEIRRYEGKSGKLELRRNGSFLFVENLAEGYGTYTGTYEESSQEVVLNVTKCDFSGYRGDNVTRIRFTRGKKLSLTLQTELCLSRSGDPFIRNDAISVALPETDEVDPSEIVPAGIVPPATVYTDPLEKTVTANGGLRMRKGPATTHPPIITVKQGEKVLVIGATENGEWVCARYGSDVGWMSAQYLS